MANYTAKSVDFSIGLDNIGLITHYEGNNLRTRLFDIWTT